MYKISRNKYINTSAFTLAEVLITLGIIGIVAALTIPNLIQNYKKHVVETKLSKFYSTINQALKLSETENGNMEEWDRLKSLDKDENGNFLPLSPEANIAWYNKYLKKYLNAVKIETSENFEGKLLIYMSDGSLLLLGESSWIFYPDAKYFDEYVKDNSNVDRNREVSGTKYFTFIFFPWDKNFKFTYKKGVEPYIDPYVNVNWDDAPEILYTSPVLGCRKEMVSNERAFCTKIIQQNGWKIPKDYPLKF